MISNRSKILIVALGSGSFVFLHGCAPASVSNAGPDASRSPDAGDASVSAGGPTFTCLEIFDCATKCKEADAGCEDACLALGTPEGKAAAVALATCFKNNACTDAPCLTTKCGTELEACTTQRAAPKPTTTVPTGAVPAELVGKWSHFYAPTSHVDEFTFDATGAAKRYVTTAFGFPGGCSTSAIGDGTGTVVFTDTKMTYYQTGGTDLYSSCGASPTPKPSPKGAYEFVWSLGADGKLVLQDSSNSTCIDDPSLASCTTTYEKQ